MAEITVTIAGRAYRMACEDGQEAHLSGLARLLDDRIAEMRTGFGEIGDMRLHVMAAITLADEVSELRARVEGLEREAARRDDLAGVVNEAAARLERLTAALGVRR